MLQSALDDHRVVHYQPIVDLAAGNIAGFEALARIAEPDGSILPPAAFIPVAEDSGLVVPLGTQVLASPACEARPRRTRRGRPLTIAVNLSARQFEPGDLTRSCGRRWTAAWTRRLHLELTETAIIDLRPDILRQQYERNQVRVSLARIACR